MKKLYKSDKSSYVAGVIGGLGEYLDTDPTFLRVIFIFILVFSGFLPAIIVYLLVALIIPRRPKTPKTETLHFAGEEHEL